MIAAPLVASLAATVLLFHLHDKRIDEASGIARGIAAPNVFYVQNDSGDSARFFAIDATTGRTRAVYTVPGAHNVDWEDLAVARDAHGVPSVWLADIGDNAATRTQVQVYRVDEPAIVRSGATRKPQVWRLRYPSGPVNAESLAVGPDGRAYVVTKSDDGRSAVYAVPRTPTGRVQTMHRVGEIRFRGHGGIIPARLQRLATGAALSPDGSLFAVRTYTDAYVWAVHAGDLAAALRARPVRVAIPLQPQGEGICFDGRALVLDSEGVDSPVDRVALPATLFPVRSSPSSSRASSASASTRASADAASTSDGSPVGWIVGGAAVAVLLGAVAAWRWRKRE